MCQSFEAAIACRSAYCVSSNALGWRQASLWYGLLEASCGCLTASIPFAGQESEEHAKWTKIWNDNPVLENLYMKRREAKLAMQKLVQAAPAGECAEECRTSEEMTHLSDMSQDLLKLANKPTFKVRFSQRTLCDLHSLPWCSSRQRIVTLLFRLSMKANIGQACVMGLGNPNRACCM